MYYSSQNSPDNCNLASFYRLQLLQDVLRQHRPQLLRLARLTAGRGLYARAAVAGDRTQEGEVTVGGDGGKGPHGEALGAQGLRERTLGPYPVEAGSVLQGVGPLEGLVVILHDEQAHRAHAYGGNETLRVEQRAHLVAPVQGDKGRAGHQHRLQVARGEHVECAVDRTAHHLRCQVQTRGMQEGCVTFAAHTDRSPVSQLLEAALPLGYQRAARLQPLRDRDQSDAFGQRVGESLQANQRDVDRKSTRLNSSHVAISYAVFCLKKKNMQPDN